MSSTASLRVTRIAPQIILARLDGIDPNVDVAVGSIEFEATAARAETLRPALITRLALRVTGATGDAADGCLFVAAQFQGEPIDDGWHFRLRAAGQDAVARLAAPASPAPHDTAIDSQLATAARGELLRFVLRACGQAARDSDVARALVLSLADGSQCPALGIDCLAPLADGLTAVRFERAPGAGPVQMLASVSTSGVRVLPTPLPRVATRWLVLHSSALRDAEQLFVLTRDCVSVVALRDTTPARVDVMAWMKAHADDRGEALDALLNGLEPAARATPSCAALATELQLRYPRRQRSALAAQDPVAAELGLAIADAGSGVFLSGWIHDPHALVDAVHLETLLGARQQLDLAPTRVPSRGARQRCEALGRKHALDELGFVAYAQGVKTTLRCLQPRVELTLRSGSRIRLVPPLYDGGPAEAKTAVLACVPPEFVTDALLTRCITPAVQRAHAEHMARSRVEAVLDWGTPPPAARLSVVIPLYRNLEYLKTQLAALAIDPATAGAEIVLVLDSPESRRGLEHLLVGLSRTLNLPLRLVVMRENFGFAAACNAGASLVRGERLLLLNSDVLPARPRWLEALDATLDAHPRTAAVGPKLLFDDDSLQHAGLYMAPDDRGRWLNRHYYKGYPAHYAPANVAREVPGITGACMLVRSDAFHAVGGFTEDYVFGDYEDSDLCMKLRAAGHALRYVPDAVLYHLERKSVKLHEGYSRGAAWAYNCALHQSRWLDALRALMARFDQDDVPSGTAVERGSLRQASA